MSNLTHDELNRLAKFDGIADGPEWLSLPNAPQYAAGAVRRSDLFPDYEHDANAAVRLVEKACRELGVEAEIDFGRRPLLVGTPTGWLVSFRTGSGTISAEVQETFPLAAARAVLGVLEKCK